MTTSSKLRKTFLFLRRTKGFKTITKSIFHLYLIITTVLGNGVSVVAGALTYNTLLAIVPIVLVFFSVLHMLPAFNSIKDSLQEFIFENIAPSNIEDFNV
ncbi:YhjD/YihY/BrkB family envelope integrity protein, partial [Psittacicella gerlachiana]